MTAEIVVAWYAPATGRAEAMVDVGGVGAIETIDDGSGHDVGAHIAVAVGPDGTPWVAYVDRTAERLLIARREGPGAWAAEIVHEAPTDGGRHDLGSWPQLVVPPDGQPVLVYGHGTTGDIWLARRSGPGCYQRSTALSDGTYAFPTVAVDSAGLVTLAALRFRFDVLQAASHGLVALQVPLPAPSACGSP